MYLQLREIKVTPAKKELMAKMAQTVPTAPMAKMAQTVPTAPMVLPLSGRASTQVKPL